MLVESHETVKGSRLTAGPLLYGSELQPKEGTMYNSRVTLVDHPMVQHKLSILRDKTTSCKQFRELVRELALFEGY